VTGLAGGDDHHDQNAASAQGLPTSFTVAALFVDPDGIYANLPGIELWDEARDARNYLGPFPVVAHPPCNRWAKLGRRENRTRDGGCFKAALADVRRWGGVLEHPAHSYAWRAFGLPRPTGPGWVKALDDPGWVCQVDQNLYGFPTRKPTWLYYVGPNPPPMPSRNPTATRGCDALWSTERSKTPPAFRDFLLETARAARMELAA
jgi:hypothetical protein